MKRTAAGFALLMVFSCAVQGAPVVFAAPDRVTFTIRDDFETGEMYGWEAYPYAQDIGFEPFTTCMRSPTHNGSKFSLAKVQRPNDIAELSEGFTKEIDLWTSAGTRFKAALFLTADRRPETLEISLCLFDGRRYFSTMRSPEANRWLELDIPVQQFTAKGKALGAGERIQAVTIQARYPVVSYLYTYVISLDDFALNGERQRRFVAVNPASTTFEMFGFSILNRHFYYGDPLDITVKPESAAGKSAVSSVICSLMDPEGKTVVSGAPMQGSGGTWTVKNAYTFKESDPRGQWTVSFTGKDAKSVEVRWGFRFLMPGKRLTPKDHPRLYFTAEELKRKMAEQSPEAKKILDNALANPDYFKKVDLSVYNEGKNLTSEAITGGPWTSIGFEYDRWRTPMSRLAGITESGAWLYAFTGDATAGEKAKEAMLKLCSFSVWNHPWMEAHGNHIYYPVGYIMGPIGIGYDYLYPLLSEQEKKFVRDAMLNKGIKPFYRDMVEMNRMPSSVTNHISVIVSNLAIDATAIYGEDPANPAFEPYLSGILAKMKRYMDRTFYPDGGYGEPMGYQDMATRDLTRALPVLEKNFGIDYTSTTNLKDTYLYPLYATYRNGDLPEFGDNGLEEGYNLTGNTFLWLSWRMKNPWTYNFIQKSLSEGQGGFMGYFFSPQGVTPKSREELVPSHRFPVKGNMVMRSDWSDAGSILIFKCGPNSNHYHVDQGTFQLMTNGEHLLTEAGLEGDYYANLYYPCYDTQPIGHNTLLLDNDPESQVPADYLNGIAALRSWPRILNSFAGRAFDSVEGDLACVFKGKLDRYTRSFLFVKPGIIFLYDRVESPAPHQFSWLFHAEHTNGKSSITATKSTVDIVRPKARLHMDILSPEIETSLVRDSWRQESFVTLFGKEGTKDAEFLAALSPSAVTDGAAPEIKPVSTLLKSAGWTGAKVVSGGTTAFAFFRTGAPGSSTAEGFTTDAERFAVTTDQSGAPRGFFLRGSSLTGANGVSFRSGAPVSASVSFTPDGADVETDATASTEITVGLAKAPREVTVNGDAISGWKYDAGAKTVKLTTPEGHTVVKVR